MSRRAAAPSRTILPDPKFKSDMLAKFMNVVMESGKKYAAERIIYGALDRITEKTGRGASEALEVLSTALENVKPMVEVKSRRVGGATYQVPCGACPRACARHCRDFPRHRAVHAPGGAPSTFRCARARPR